MLMETTPLLGPLLGPVVELPKASGPGTTHVWFEPEDTPCFYWMIPQSPTHRGIGFIAEEGKSARNKLERF